MLNMFGRMQYFTLQQPVQRRYLYNDNTMLLEVVRVCMEMVSDLSHLIALYGWCQGVWFVFHATLILLCAYQNISCKARINPALKLYKHPPFKKITQTKG